MHRHLWHEGDVGFHIPWNCDLRNSVASRSHFSSTGVLQVASLVECALHVAFVLLGCRLRFFGFVYLKCS